MQSRGGEGIASGIEERRRRVASASAGGGSGGGEEDDPTNVRNTDIVVWHSFGSTHNPRIEDWPVMPCEKITVGLKPVNFFGGNPGVDVAPARGEESRSVIFGGGGGGEGCCEERKV
jgi:primary-amine oxidase